MKRSDVITMNENDAFRDSLGNLLSKNYWYIKTYLNILIKESGLDVTTEQWSVMVCIYSTPGITQTDIANIVFKDKSNVTRILDILEKNGHIERRKNPSDRRSYTIYLTEKGEETIKKLFPLVKKANEMSTKNLSKEELDTLIKQLKTVRDTLKELI